MLGMILLIGTITSTIITLGIIGMNIACAKTSFRDAIRPFPFVVWRTLASYNKTLAIILSPFLVGTELLTVISLIILYFPVKFLWWVLS